MYEYWKATFVQLANGASDVFFAPGISLFDRLTVLAPELFGGSAAVTGEATQLTILLLSLLAWIVLVLALRILWRQCKPVLFYARRAREFLSLRVKLKIHYLRRFLQERLEIFQSAHGSIEDHVVHEAQFDGADIAILKSTSKLGPGFAISAPELAAELNMTPGEAQQSLDRLRGYQLVDATTGSTDNFGTYRISRSGMYFLSRHAAAT